MALRPIRVCLILAISKNNKIGGSTGLPWRIPSDLAHFRRVTTGKVMVMGRKTFDTINHKAALNSVGRSLIIVSRKPHEVEMYGDCIATVVGSVEEAIVSAKQITRIRNEQEELMVTGGREIYLQSLEQASRIYLTVVDAHVTQGDIELPELSEEALVSGGQWVVISRCAMYKKEVDEYDAEFLVLDRKS